MSKLERRLFDEDFFNDQDFGDVELEVNDHILISNYWDQEFINVHKPVKI